MMRQSGDIPGGVLLSWAIGQLQFLDQVLGCAVGMAQSMGLHRGYPGCCRCGCRHRGNFRDSWCLWFWSCRHCGCNRRLWQLCRLGRCRQCCRNVRSSWSLWWGCSDSWGSVSGLETVFTKVLSSGAVDHAITGVYLVAVFWQDMYHSGRDPDLTEGVVHCNGLTSIQGVQGIYIICLPVTWRHQSGHQFICKSGELPGWCCKFWQEWWS